MYDLLTNEEREDSFLELLSEILGSHRSHFANKKQIAFDCPRCSYEKGLDRDGKGNLEINYGKGVYKCWACGEEFETHGDAYSLVRTWGTTDQLRRFINLKIRFSYERDGDEYVYVPKEKLTLPKEFCPLSNSPYVGLFKPYFDYLASRRITKEMIEKFNIGCCWDGKYKGRIIIPSYNEDGELNYWVSRSIHKWVKRMKYINCDVPKQTIIFNEKHIDWDKPVFLVEGPFDHIPLPNSIPLLGKEMYELLFKMLYENATKVILVLDPDAWKKLVKIYNKLDGGRLYEQILYVKMPKDDKEGDIDVAKFNELYGQPELFNYIKKGLRKLTV